MTSFINKNGAPHINFDAHNQLNANLPAQWIGRASQNDSSTSLASTVT
jgi:hypothetical protein